MALQINDSDRLCHVLSTHGEYEGIALGPINWLLRGAFIRVFVTVQIAFLSTRQRLHLGASGSRLAVAELREQQSLAIELEIAGRVLGLVLLIAGLLLTA